MRVLGMHAAAALLLLASPVTADNDYKLITKGQVCPEAERIQLPCGSCGPNWGALTDCEDTCNLHNDCNFITYFEDNGCRIYKACDLEAKHNATTDVGTDIYQRLNPKPIVRPDGPCDIFEKGGAPCVAAHSITRALYAKYQGPLYRLIRDSDHAGLDIGVGLGTGLADSSTQDTFCAGTSCYIERIYDQSPQGNHLDTAPPGGACHIPLSPVNASKERITLGGQSVYGAYFEGKMGYRRDFTTGVAKGQMEQTMYMVTRGDHVNGGCCFDYGNAESDNNDDGAGTMEAIYFGTSKGWGYGDGPGPWVMADLENGLWGSDQRQSGAKSITSKYVTAMAKGKVGGFAIKSADATTGDLSKTYEGKRPAGYETMKLQGSIILGIGGDNSCGAIGTFYEGAMTATYTADSVDADVQANIVAAGYGK